MSEAHPQRAGTIRRMAHRVPWLILIAWASSIAHAQDPVLHEFIPNVRSEEATLFGGGDADEPEGIMYDGELLPPPEGGDLAPDERAMQAVPGDGQLGEEEGRRSPTFRPDRVTDLDGTLGYFEVFTPAIAPFKRVSALDTVVIGTDGTTPVLGVGDARSVPVAVEGATSEPPDARPRDRFWGNVVLDFRSGSTVPFPSVSPESRILTLRTEPETALTIQKDGADNFYAVLAEPRAGQVRVVFLTDAPRSYFGETVPEVDIDSLRREAKDLPAPVRRAAQQFAAEIGIRDGASLREGLDRLIAHFRAFEESEEPPEDTGNIYLDLARGMKGVCRHRAYAFVITALGLGIPARFVQNEAHAWVEVKVASLGWMRVDLGGAPVGLEAHNADDRPHYRPETPDPFPRPDAYQQAYAEAARMEGGAGVNGAQQGDAGVAHVDSQGATGMGTGPAQPPPSGSGRSSLVVSVDRPRYEVFRGRALGVSGRASGGGGEGVAGLRIEVLLQGAREMLLGVTVTRGDGYFHGSFGVPPDLVVGDYHLIVRSPGNETYLPGVAQ